MCQACNGPMGGGNQANILQMLKQAAQGGQEGQQPPQEASPMDGIKIGG